MNTAELIEHAVSTDDIEMDDILSLQLRIARRADELAHARVPTAEERSDWQCWYDAEKEILGEKNWGSP